MGGLRLGLVAMACTVVVSTRARAQGTRDLTVEDAIRLALAHSGEIMVAAADTELADDEGAIARAVYDPRLIANAHVGRDNQLGGPARLAVDDRTINGSVELTGRVESGTTYSLSFNAIRDRLQSQFLTIYDPAYTTSLMLSVTQPLMRGAWKATNRLPIVIAGLRRDVSEQVLRQHVEAIVGDVEVAYWRLALAYKEREARTSSLKLAEDQLAESSRLVRMGTISDLDVTEARAGVGRMQRQLLLARQELTDAQGALRKLIVGEPSWLPDDEIVPTDDPELAHTQYALDEHLKVARESRPDLRTVRAQLQAERAVVGVTQNELLPQLDVVLTGGLFGFAGQLDPNSGVFDGSTGFTPDGAANGGIGQAFKNVATNGNYMIALGLKLELPLHNTAAKARSERQRHAVTRAQAAEHALLMQVETDIRTSLTHLTQDDELEKAADEAVTVNTQLLTGMRKRFASGAVTSFEVLRVADQLARAQIDAVRSRVSYRISLARLATADGTLLQQHHIDLSAIHRP